MSLIERLGGYENALMEFNQFFALSLAERIDPEIDIDGEKVLIDCLSDALLEYRREHGIFNFGDRIIFHPIGNNVVFWDDCLTMFLSQGLIRHATDKEIEQGFRDD